MTVQHASTSRPVQEFFTWREWQWDVTKILHDVKAGKAGFTALTVSRAFIEQYAKSALGHRLGQDCEPVTLGMFAYASIPNALALPAAALEQPLLFVAVPTVGHGILTMPNQPEFTHVLADGNHRIAKAFQEHVAGLPAWVLTQEQSARYRVR